MVYEIGDTVWMEIGAEPQQVKVVALNVFCGRDGAESIYVVRQGLRFIDVPADKLFRTKEELLKSL